MFLHLSVILFTEGCLPLGPGGVHPRHPRQTPPDRHPRAPHPPSKATVADGTHPNGMHSCWKYLYSANLYTGGILPRTAGTWNTARM